MTCTSSTKQHRRRIAAAILALPLTLAMTGTAFATGASDSRGASTAELRTSSDAARSSAAADNSAADKAASEKAAADKSASEKAAADKSAADKAASEKAAADKPAADRAADRAAEAKADKPSTGSAAGAASGKSAAAATTTTVNATYVNGNTDSSKADRPNAPVAGTPSQPLSNADKNGTGANPGGTCTHSYCSNGTGLEPGNGNDSAPAKGQPCAGCVGKADNKNPKGQAPDGSDHNNGYECDGNQGIGKMNPAHTGCTGTPTTPPTAPERVSICHVKGSGFEVLVIDKSQLAAHLGHGDKALPASGACGTNGGGGGGGSERVTVCHKTGNGFQPLEFDKSALQAHLDHGDTALPASGVCTTTTTTFDQCPNIDGDQPMGTTCTTGGGGGNPPVDVCLDVPGMQQMGPCATPTGGGTPVLNPPAVGGATPIAGTPGNQPAVVVPVVGPPTVVPPVIVPQGTRPPVLIGTVEDPATAPVPAAAPRALPFTGTDAALLAELGALLLLVGGGVLVAARRERTARAA